MADETTNKSEAVVESINNFCPICGARWYHTELDGMPGWLCSDPDCEFFMPD